MAAEKGQGSAMKETTWDLSVFYHGFDDPALRADIEAVKVLIHSGHALLLADEKPVQKLEQLLALLTQLTAKLYRAFGYCQLTLAVDAEHVEAFRHLDELSTLYVDVEVLQSACVRYVGSLKDLPQVIAESVLLTQHAFMLKEFAVRSVHMLPESMEKWMLRMSLSGGDAFGKLRDQLMGTHTVQMDDKSLPLPAVRGMAYDPDAEVRKAAYEAELKSYEKVALPMAFCLAGIKGEALTLCEARGYSDVLTEQLEASRMDRETLDAMLTAIRESLPDFRRYLKAKAKKLGHLGGLPFYDLFAPITGEGKPYTIEEAEALLCKVFGKVHPEMSDFIRHAFDKRWIDVYPREGKEGGAFCAGNHELKISRVLTNFVGSFSDVSTLAHELGHAWHNRCMERLPALLADAPMPLAETASIFNETLLAHEVRGAADAEAAFALLENSLMEKTQLIVDIYSRYLFETAVFEARKTHTPTVEELNALMLSAQEEAYGDGLDAEIRHPYMWVNKSHYYTPGLHFYNFPYAFGLLFGLGVFAKYLEQGKAFMPQYDELLAKCGTGLVADVAQSVGIDVRSEAYWRSALQIVRDEIDEFLRLCA